ncbi:hypothetical protein [Parasulfitobacter algicola]|uniref:Glycosyltransferase RgtA/B/C/D-like domain-containing protein n=1 Tax=Parasulfitobacter algicola TaxID=2614809 RepID=A0ABX2IVG4_9RHOB|nr:hypothetical protein [Sulfitobacter algicola]NSX56907.1 hypothetical protein [Sulfitobacter algicola]
MTDKNDVDLAKSNRVLTIVIPIWLALIVLAVLNNFMYLDASSLWLDELFTVYFSDPNQPSFSAFLNRASEDVHPPGYYALVWITGLLTGADTGMIARGISATLAALSLVLICLAMPKWISRPARLFSCTLAATSHIYFLYAPQGRSYALSWVLVILLLMLALDINRAMSQGKPISLKLSTFTITGIISGLCHMYLVPLIGAKIAIMLCFSQSWKNRFWIAVSGLIILTTMLVFLNWQADKIILDVSDTWFSADSDFLWRQTNAGLKRLFGSALETPLSNVIIAASVVSVVWILIKRIKIQDLRPIIFDTIFVFSSPILALALAILVTLFYAPSYSFRYFIVLVPFYWILMGFLFEIILRSSLKWMIIGIIIFTTIIFIPLSARILWSDLPTKQPWRETAQFVDNTQECVDAILPVVTFAEKFITGSVPVNFYGYYLNNGTARDWLSYPEDEVTLFPGTGPVRNIVVERITGNDPCPILLWDVAHSNPANLEIARQSMMQTFDLPEGSTIILKTIKLPESNLFMRLLGMSSQEEGYFLLVQR